MHLNKRLFASTAVATAMWIISGGRVCAGVDSIRVTAQERGYIEAFATSPDGTRVAEVVGGSSDEASSHILILSLRAPGKVSCIYSGMGISNLIWLGKEKVAFVMPGPKGGIFEEDVNTRKLTVLRQGGSGIGGLLFDQGSRSLAYTYAVPWSWKGRPSLRVTRKDSTLQFLFPKWAQLNNVRIGTVNLGDGSGYSLGHMLPTSSAIFPVAQLAWRKGRLLVLRSSWSSFATSIVDAGTGRVLSDRWPLYREGTVAVSRRGRLAVTSMRLWENRPKPMCGCKGGWKLYVLGREGAVHQVTALATGQVVYISHVWWSGEGRLFAQILGADRPGGAWYWKLVEVNWRRNRVIRVFRWPGGDLGSENSDCSLDDGRSKAICIAQTLVSPPKLVEVNLSTGAMRNLGKIDAAQRKLDFEFREVRVSSGHGKRATGFLALPRSSRERAVPLAVMLYGFDEAYSRDAQWVTSYPVAQLVHSGIAVLLLNFAYDPAPSHASFAATREDLRNAISLIANAVPAVRATGVKVSRAMIMGWSFGGLYAAHAIQKLHEYVAAQVGDPAVWNTTGYALADGMLQSGFDFSFGGPPIRRYIDRYLMLDPVADGRPANGPILLEFVSRNPDAGQFLEEWRAVGTEVEAFVYHHSVHWLNVPTEARISRERNFDWAKLNLFGPQSVSPAELRRVGLTVPKNGWWTRRLR